jgi:FlaA1/EpsC-like NDP-sugar epimerase
MQDINTTFIDGVLGKIRWLFQHYSIPRWMLFAIDNTAVFGCFIIAYLLRYNFEVAAFHAPLTLQQAGLTVAVYASISLIFHSYSDLLRHTTIMDIMKLFMATSLSYLTLFIVALVSRRLNLGDILILPLSIITIHYVLITVMLFFFRICIKAGFQMISVTYVKKKKVLIMGAGEMGVTVKRAILSDGSNGYQVVGFIDDQKKLHGKNINGIPVFHPRMLCQEFVRKQNIHTLILAIKEITPVEKSSLIRTAINYGLEVLDTPSIDTWLNGQLQIRQIKKVKVEDLLGRNPIELNQKKIGIGLTGKTILVTGAAGSIGSEIVRQLIRFNIKRLILVDQAETPMFYIQNEIRALQLRFSVEFMVADVTNAHKMELVFREFLPEIVFHAAAYKHVPLMENNPHEAIRVNIGGTRLLTRLAALYNVKKFVMISTDKAVNPANIMGASKRICEIVVQLKAQTEGNKTQFIVTRFGNVLGSNGSVIPTFLRQIEEGGPVTVTHPEITRYFMTIPEACQLVLEAGFMGHGGEIFEFDMGKPVRIADLARNMIKLSGFVPDEDIKIVYTGLRPGDKLFEELLTNQEATMPTYNPKIRVAQVQRIMNHEAPGKIENLLTNLYRMTNYEVVKSCFDIIPQFSGAPALHTTPHDKQGVAVDEGHTDRLSFIRTLRLRRSYTSQAAK